MIETISTWILWFETHDKFASWAQAFAAIVALFLAIAVPVFQRWLDDRSERKRKRREGEFIAVAVYPDILEMRARHRRVRGVMGVWPDAPDVLELTMDRPDIRRGLANELRRAKLALPPTFESEMPRFILLGEKEGTALRQVVSLDVV